MKRFGSLITIYLLCLISFAGCSPLYRNLASYDPVSYKSLTDLKPEVVLLYQTFADEGLRFDKIETIRLKLARMYEYEKGKGEDGLETLRQIEVIQAMFEKDVKDRVENGRWDGAHLNNQRENISDAFDIAIQTERLKQGRR